jgi:hypothetical protein
VPFGRSAFTPRNRPEKLQEHPCRSGKVMADHDTDVGCRPRSGQVPPSSSEIRRHVAAIISQ